MSSEQLPNNPNEILVQTKAAEILREITIEAASTFNFRLIHDGDFFGRACFVKVPTITQETSSELIKKIEKTIKSEISKKLTGALLNQRRNQGLDSKIVQTNFEFDNLEITFQDQPYPCLRVIYLVKCNVK